MVVLEIYLEMLTNFFEILHPPLMFRGLQIVSQYSFYMQICLSYYGLELIWILTINYLENVSLRKVKVRYQSNFNSDGNMLFLTWENTDYQKKS